MGRGSAANIQNLGITLATDNLPPFGECYPPASIGAKGLAWSVLPIIRDFGFFRHVFIKMLVLFFSKTGGVSCLLPINKARGVPARQFG